MLAAFLYVPPLAHLLGQTGPSWAGWLTALLAIPAVLAADAIYKRLRRLRAGDRTHHQVTGSSFIP
ncbi:hypothetical protein ACOJVU_15270, partial [Mycobacterium sp. THU-M104]|uniref:hypothetical protein n=1 Tax=Mycobacterium sp. THU-M104 TaxID=3410515 RepID=UPI003B9C3DD9